MAEKRKYLTPQDLIDFIKCMPRAQLESLGSRARAAQRSAQAAFCEEFYTKLESLLPTHDASRLETFKLLARLRAGRPNLPAGLC